MPAPPSAEMRSPAVWQNGRANSQQRQFQKQADLNTEPLKAQARRLFALCQAAAATIATLAYGLAQ